MPETPAAREKRRKRFLSQSMDERLAAITRAPRYCG